MKFSACFTGLSRCVVSLIGTLYVLNSILHWTLFAQGRTKALIGVAVCVLAYVFCYLCQKCLHNKVKHAAKTITGKFDVHITVDNEYDQFLFYRWTHFNKIESAFPVGVGGVHPQQLMTSVFLVGKTGEEAINYAHALAKQMTEYGMHVMRIKIEAEAQSSGITSFLNQKCVQLSRLLNNGTNYYEFHWKVNDSDDQKLEKIHDICKKTGASIATNLKGKRVSNSNAKKALMAIEHAITTNIELTDKQLIAQVHVFAAKAQGKRYFQNVLIAYRVRARSFEAAKALRDQTFDEFAKENLVFDSLDETSFHNEFVFYDTDASYDDGFVSLAK